jgi:predicted Zn-dependent protease with MMP-like domain
MKNSRLVPLAEQTVATAPRRLPADIREAAAGVAVCFEPRPNAALVAEGSEPDLLGLFVGHTHGGELSESQPLPPQILLFVDNLWDYAGSEVEAFRDEVRLTYLHELGHYLGWDEGEISRRGLD